MWVKSFTIQASSPSNTIDAISFTVADTADPTSVVAVNEPIFLQAAPIVTAINAGSSSPGSLSVGERVTFTLNINTTVQVVGDPTLLLSNGATATFDAAASTGTSLVFDYTVMAGQDTADLLVTSLTLNGATIAAPGVFGFTAANSYPTGVIPSSVTTADMNWDGKLDLVVSGFGGVSVLLGDGFGGFVRIRYDASPGPNPFWWRI